MQIFGVNPVDKAAQEQVTRVTGVQAAEVQGRKEQQELIRAVKSVNESGLMGSDHELTFSMDRNAKRMVVRIVDRNTHEVVMQIPDQQVLRMAEELPKL